MKMIFWKRRIYREDGDKCFGFHRGMCSCYTKECGVKDFRTTSWTVYVWRWAITVSREKPKECRSPF